jgi:Flp pilus assembly protein CpaB
MASSLTVEQETSSESTRSRPRPVAPRRRKVRERISLGHLFMIAAALLAFVLVVSVLQDRTKVVKVIVAKSAISPGATITVDQVREVDVPADSDLVPSMATLADVAGGKVTAAQRIEKGDPITTTALARQSVSTGLRAMSLPIERSMAVGGDLAAGDRVDVISVDGGNASYVAIDLEVLGTQGSQASSGALSSASLTDYYVTVSVGDQAALALAQALEIGKVSILRSTGATPVPPDQRAAAAPSSASSSAGANGDG